jgi:hypothetical protein
MANYSISNGAVQHINADYGGFVNVPIGDLVVTIGAPMAFSQAFAGASNTGHILEGNVTYQNKSLVTGRTAQSVLTGAVNTAGGGPNYYPGTEAPFVDSTSSYN